MLTDFRSGMPGILTALSFESLLYLGYVYKSIWNAPWHLFSGENWWASVNVEVGEECIPVVTGVGLHWTLSLLIEHSVQFHFASPCPSLHHAQAHSGGANSPSFCCFSTVRL